MAATDSAARVVVCDAGPLIHLDELGRVALLDDFNEVLVPSAVWSEVTRHRPGALTVAGVPFRQVSTSSTLPTDLEVLGRALPLHEGEREALQVAREQQADLLLTDDTAARLAARTLGVSVHGTIGILFRAVRRGRMTGPEVAALLRSLPTVSTLHVKRGLLAEFIRRAEQST
jgi:predicted nucleic acid-binding protein